jgi:hypothetical protein
MPTCSHGPAPGVRTAGPAHLALENHGSGAHPPAADEVADPDFDDVAAAQLAVDGKIKHRAVAQASLAIEPEADGPDLLRLEGSLCAELSTRVPRLLLLEGRIVLGTSYGLSPAGPCQLGEMELREGLRKSLAESGQAAFGVDKRNADVRADRPKVAI